MLTGVTDGIFCCLLGAPPNAVGPLESVESSDGYTFVEVKPGRVLRVKHAGPAPLPTPPPPLSDAAQGDQSGLVHCQRRITVYTAMGGYWWRTWAGHHELTSCTGRTALGSHQPPSR